MGGAKVGERARLIDHERNHERTCAMSVVLVVDDDAAIRQYVSDFLEMEGHDVRFATDGPSALASIRAERPDCVLLDVMMPGMSGHEVLAEIRRVDGGPQLPVVMVTAAAGEAQSWQAWTGGVDFIVPKPIDTDHLLRVLEYLTSASAHA
ncbi:MULTISPECIES: response regulator [Nocardioides]|uniref:Response regulator n=1 Tax=Nocardioides vastitatis TaxID=2568655 RepID=A0ABW0ZNG5_9ACTN|nr:response regulator [Nocardioides sp.]THJ08753.1 response regulator [Nocardioides sp.]